jgi:hypothetical protein
MSYIVHYYMALSLLTASGMLLHAFPLMSVSSLREFPENCVYRHGGFNCFMNKGYDMKNDML